MWIQIFNIYLEEAHEWKDTGYAGTAVSGKFGICLSEPSPTHSCHSKGSVEEYRRFQNYSLSLNESNIHLITYWNTAWMKVGEDLS